MIKRFLTSVLAAAAVLSASAGGSRDVSILNSEAGIPLGATILEPEGTPKAVLVLVTGSGCQNRDEEIMGKTPFRTIAEGLAARGYATVRFDDRGAGESGGDYSKATAGDFKSDALAVLHYADSLFRGVPCGILGHSAGGQTAIVCAPDSACDFIVTMAAPAWEGDSLIMSQSRALAVGLTGRWDNEPLQRKLLDIVKGPLPATLALPMMIAVHSEALGKELASMPEVQAQITNGVAPMLGDWYREFVRYNPAADITAVSVPWLALNGSKDIQVLPGNLDTILQLNPAATTIEIEGHNHMFQPCVTGLVDEYAKLPGDVSEQTISIIADWLDTNVK